MPSSLRSTNSGSVLSSAARPPCRDGSDRARPRRRLPLPSRRARRGLVEQRPQEHATRRGRVATSRHAPVGRSAGLEDADDGLAVPDVDASNMVNPRRLDRVHHAYGDRRPVRGANEQRAARVDAVVVPDTTSASARAPSCRGTPGPARALLGDGIEAAARRSAHRSSSRRYSLPELPVEHDTSSGVDSDVMRERAPPGPHAHRARVDPAAQDQLERPRSSARIRRAAAVEDEIVRPVDLDAAPRVAGRRGRPRRRSERPARHERPSPTPRTARTGRVPFPEANASSPAPPAPEVCSPAITTDPSGAPRSHAPQLVAGRIEALRTWTLPAKACRRARRETPTVERLAGEIRPPPRARARDPRGGRVGQPAEAQQSTPVSASRRSVPDGASQTSSSIRRAASERPPAPRPRSCCRAAPGRAGWIAWRSRRVRTSTVTMDRGWPAPSARATASPTPSPCRDACP